MSKIFPLVEVTDGFKFLGKFKTTQIIYKLGILESVSFLYNKNYVILYKNDNGFFNNDKFAGKIIEWNEK